jgi:hypothetical protein
MAIYDTLPVYKQSYDLLMQTVQLIPSFPKTYKYSLGTPLQEALIALILLIFKANTATQKADYLHQSREKVEEIRLLFRLVNDLKLLSLKEFVDVQVMIESVSKQVCGWEKSV